MAEVQTSLDGAAQAAMGALEEKFVFRKLGICYDYAAKPDEFPPKTLPTAEEAKASKPNPYGLGTGMAECAVNGALLFDGYLLRLELGLARGNEDRLLDRLIGGFIRIATTAQRGFLPPGITPDGRGFYSCTGAEAHLFWAFSLWRGVTSPAIALESQAKMSNIASRWIARIKQDENRLARYDGRGAAEVLSPELLPALYAVAARVTGEKRWQDEYAALRVAVSPALARANAGARELLLRQLALHTEYHLCPDEGRKQQLAAQMRETATAAAAFLGAFRELKPAILEEQPSFDWRALSAAEIALKQLEGGTSEWDIPLAWRRLRHELETVGRSAAAALAVLLAGDKALAESHAETLAELLGTAPWDRLCAAAAVAPALSIHARGVELGLWDAALLERGFCIDGEANLVDKYLTDDYDDANPDKAGHTESPAKPEDDDQGGKRRSRGRRRRRKKR